MKKTETTKKYTIKKSIVDYLVEIHLFDKFNVNELRILHKHIELIYLKKDEVLFRESDQDKYVCFIVEGQLNVIKESATGEDSIIATLSKGKSIGEMSIIDESSRSATVIAATKTTLIKLTQEDLDQILDEYPKIGIKIFKGIARLVSMNLRMTTSRLVDYMQSLT